jgi:WD40 repeat protein
VGLQLDHRPEGQGRRRPQRARLQEERGALQHRVATGAPFIRACPCDDGSVFVGTKSTRRFDLATGKATLSIDAHPRGEATDLALSPSGKHLATISGVRVVGADNTVALFDAKSGKRLGTFKLEPGNGEAVAFSRDGKLVYALTNEDRIVALSVPALKKASSAATVSPSRGRCASRPTASRSSARWGST